MKQNKKRFILLLLLQVFFLLVAASIAAAIPHKAKEKKTELILENKYALVLAHNGNAKLTGGVGGLYGGNGVEKSPGEILYDQLSAPDQEHTSQEQAYRIRMENLWVTQLTAVRKDFRRAPDYIGHIAKDTAVAADDETNRIRELKNKERGGYFYSSDTDNLIRFNVPIAEIKARYGAGIFEKMQKPEEVIDQYGVDKTPFDEQRKLLAIRTLGICLLLNLLWVGTLVLRKSIVI